MKPPFTLPLDTVDSHSLYSDRQARLRTTTDNSLKTGRKIFRVRRKKRVKRRVQGGTPSSSLVFNNVFNEVQTRMTQTASSLMIALRRSTRSRMMSS